MRRRSSNVLYSEELEGLCKMKNFDEKKELPLANLKLLKQDMEDKEWIITCFSFLYKQVEFIVLSKRYIENKPPKFALLKFDFIKANNSEEHLEFPVNAGGLILETNQDKAKMRKFFNIKWAENIGDIFKQFNIYLSEFIPTKVNDNITVHEKSAMVKSLSKSDSEDPKKIYCFAVRRNPLNKDGTPQKRSIFNDNKTRLLRPSLYSKLGMDKTISFCYSANRNDHKEDSEILGNMAKNI